MTFRWIGQDKEDCKRRIADYLNMQPNLDQDDLYLIHRVMKDADEYAQRRIEERVRELLGPINRK